MAKCQVTMPVELERKLRQAEDTATIQAIVDKALKEAGAVMLQEVRDRLSAVIATSKRSTGELLASLGVTPVKHGVDGWNIHIGFNEPRREQHDAKESKANGKPHRSYYVATNAMIANVLEYGKSGQKAHPFMRPASKAKSKDCEDIAARIIRQELDKL